MVIVDDGSKDKTFKVAEKLGVNVIKHHKNLGKGEAIKTGISHTKEDIILFLDADASIVNFPTLFYAIPEKYDMAVHFLNWYKLWRNQTGNSKKY